MSHGRCSARRGGAVGRRGGLVSPAAVLLRWGRALLGAVLLVLVAGCGAGGEDVAADQGTAEGGGGRCAQRSLAHKHGAADLSGVPERVVPLSFRDQEAVLALGRTPVAVQDGFYELPYLQWPWVREHLDGVRPEVLAAGETNFEQVAALRPDLILGASSGMTEGEHRILSQIAPTVGPLSGYVDFGVPWQEALRTAGRALCREAEAEERIARLEGRIAEVREQHPELVGATAVVAMAGGPEGSFWVYGPQDSRGRFLEALGMRQPGEVAALAGERFVATVSAERLDLLNADVLIWMASPEQRAALEANPIYRQLDVVREGRVLYLPTEGVLTAAFTNTTALSLPYVLEELVPRITGTLAG